MIELAVQEGRAPKKRATTVKRTTFKPLEGKPRPMTAAESRAAIFQKLDFIRGELQDQLKGFHNRYEGLACDLKESARQRDVIRKMLSDFGTRLAAVERQMNVAVTTFTPAQMKAAGLRPETQYPQSDLLTAWEAKIEAAVKRLEDLPDPCTPMQLSDHFGVTYQVIQKLWLKGNMPVIREGRTVTIRHACIAAYMKIYGVPCMRRAVRESGGRA